MRDLDARYICDSDDRRSVHLGARAQRGARKLMSRRMSQIGTTMTAPAAT
jgi:hypothetical protein